MKEKFSVLFRSFCALSLFVLGLFALAACAPPPPATGNNQNTSNANAAPSTPANANSSAATKQAKGASIEVASVPPGAGVTLVPTSEAGAGMPQSYGVTPTTISNLAPGEYLVSIDKPGYKNAQKEIKLKENATVKVNETLKKEAARRSK